MTNPLRSDPTRTVTLRGQFITALQVRFRSLRGAVKQLVVEEDAFGLKPRRHNLFTANTRWAFETDDRKLDGFNRWLKNRIDRGVLELPASGGNPAEPWTNDYISSSYRKGVLRAYTDAHSEELAKSADFYAGSKSQFLQEAFGGPEAVSKLRLLQTRTFEQLKGVTATMSQQMSSVLADGLARGDGPRTIARNLNNRVASLTRQRALVIARTEVIHAHAEGQLDSFQRLGVEEVGVMAEWSTAGDDLVCALCAELEGVLMTIREARGLIPRHPNCRCAWLPANVGESKKDQTRDKRGVERALQRSVRAERPKASASVARARSTWAGADSRIGLRARRIRKATIAAPKPTPALKPKPRPKPKAFQPTDLTKDELVSVNYYTSAPAGSSDPARLRRLLAKDPYEKVRNEFDERFVKHFPKAAEKMPEIEGTAYRGITLPADSPLLKEGAKIRSGIVESWTTAEDVAEGYAITTKAAQEARAFGLPATQEKVIVVIEKKGTFKDISSIVSNPSGKEVWSWKQKDMIVDSVEKTYTKGRGTVYKVNVRNE